MLIHHPNITSRNSLLLCADIANPKSYSGTGTTIIDLTRNKYNMGIVGTVTYSNSFGGILSINGATTNYITFNASATMFGSNNARSIEYWLTVSTLSSRQNFYTTPSNLFMSVETNGSIRLSIITSSQILVTSSGLISSGVWYNITVTRDASNRLSIYLNGILVAGPFNYLNNFASTGVRVGGSTAYGGFNGSVALIRSYSIALTSSQILQNYNATKGRFGL
jgi:hypothetical protein